ncbi:MAG: hypothetical protein QOF82_1558 [Frankiales bacterium]|nr:hypothetical protein [Frankiales bacterium]
MKRSQLLVLGITTGLVLGGGAASAATKTPTTVRACVDPKGTLSLLSKGKCSKETHLLALGVKGPRGLTGKPGAPGVNGLNGVNGTNGAPGPSDVYAWAGALSSTTPKSALISVPSGDYVVRWQGWVNNYSGVATSDATCYLDENNGGIAEIVKVPAGGVAFDSYERLIHAASAFTVAVECSSLGVMTVDNVVVTATATGTLHGTGVTNLP